MSQKGRKVRNSSRESPGSNVLFTLGLISVIALLIVGWVMTQGGMTSLADKAQNLANISINKTPKPTPANDGFDVNTTQPSRDNFNQRINKLITQYEAELKQLNETWEKRLEQTKRDYERKINSMKIEIISLRDENKRLREKK